MNPTDVSSLMRSTTADLFHTLAHRRARRAADAARFGTDSEQHRYCVQSIYRVVAELDRRGVAA